MRVLIDARLAVRGLGIATATERLMEALAPCPAVDVRLNATSLGWNWRGKLATVARTGLLDVSPGLDPRTWSTDVVHYFGNTAPRHPTRHVVVTVHDLMMLRRTSKKARLFKTLLVPGLLQGRSKIVAISSKTADDLVKELGIPSSVITVIPHGKRPGPKVSAVREHILMFGGSSDARKRIGLGMEAYARYAQSVGADALPLIVAGRSGVSDQDLGRAAHGNVRIFSDPSGEQVDSLLASAACLVFPSRQEGFGLPIIEAGEAMTPVVCDLTADIPNEVLGRHVLGVSGTDVDEWARSIEQAVRLGPVPDALPQIPTWADVSEQYLGVYESVAK